MLKKIMSMMVALCLICSVSWADGLEGIQIIAPQVDPTASVGYVDNLNITLQLDKEVDAALTIIRIDQPERALQSVEQEQLVKEMINHAPTMHQLQAPVLEDDPYILTEFYEIEAVKYSKKSLKRLYRRYAELLSEAYAQYNQQYQASRQDYSQEVLDKMIRDRQLLVNGLTELQRSRQIYENYAIQMMRVQHEYEKCFRETLLYQLPITSEGALPYFNYTLEEVVAGKYEIVITQETAGGSYSEIMRFNIAQ